MKTSDLTGAILDYWVARALGYRFWLEKRGDYRLAVRQAPGEKEPYKASRDWESQVDRYAEVFSFSDIKCGFFGVGVPKFSSSWADGGPIIEREWIETAATYIAEVRDGWSGMMFEKDDPIQHAMLIEHGPTLLIAAMRVFVASRFGNKVPDEVK